MSDFITLTCPNCGGKLTVTPQATNLVCQNCGVEHMIRWQAGTVMLEAFARCPKCHRNDQAKKISGMVSSEPVRGQSIIFGSFLINPPTQPKREKFHVLKKITRVIVLMLGAMYGGMSCLWLVIISGMILYGIFFQPEMISKTLENGSILQLVLPILGLFVGVGFGIATLLFSRKMNRDQIKFEDEEDARMAVEMPKWEADMKKWEQAKLKWNRLYYCERDDIVFDPACGEYSMLGDFEAFLYR